MMNNIKTVCIDLDNTILHFESWEGEHIFGKPIEGAIQALSKLKENGYTIIIHTTRANKQLIEQELNMYQIPFDYINENPKQPSNSLGGKTLGDIYVDDRAIQFDGNWTTTLEKISSFETWEKRKMTEQSDDFLNASIGFLKEDFSQSYQQMRHYDNLIINIITFSFVQLLFGIGAAWGVYNFDKSKDNAQLLNENYRFVIVAILFICYLFCIFACFQIYKNRVYFVRIARYVNYHRSFFLSKKPIGFNNVTDFYQDYTKPKTFDIFSTHLVFLGLMLFTSVIISIIVSIFVHLILNSYQENIYNLFIFLIPILALVLPTYLFRKYLKKQDKI